MSGKVNMGRTTAAVEGDAVVLLIGMRINHFWAVHHWLPVMLSMFRMLSELKKDRSRGMRGHVLLAGSPRTYYVVQYWGSKEQLYGYATSPEMFHHRVWKYINGKEKSGKLPGHVGLWHESYVSPEGSYESIYVYMPPFGLAEATGVLPIEQRGRRAQDRFAHRTRPQVRPEPEGASGVRAGVDAPQT